MGIPSRRFKTCGIEGISAAHSACEPKYFACMSNGYSKNQSHLGNPSQTLTCDWFSEKPVAKSYLKQKPITFPDMGQRKSSDCFPRNPMNCDWFSEKPVAFSIEREGGAV